MEHAGRIAVVTGAAQGIGRDYALALAEDGAAVVAADINLDGAEETAALVAKNGGTAHARRVDVSDRASTLELAAWVRAELGAAHILVNNAAIYHSMRLEPALEVDIDYWRRVLSVNLDGALLMSQAFAPLLVEAGWGRIVNQSSVAAYGASGVYTVSKLALISLTHCLAAELGRHGVTVNAIAPGPIATEATEVTVPKERLDRMIASAYVAKRVGPEALISTLRYLCSPGSDWVTAQTLLVDGGVTRRV